jgi:hypothetical protein
LYALFNCVLSARVMAATAEAEREGNAKIITAEAEFKAATT